MDLAALVEKVGRCQVYWQKHCDQWSNAEWLQRRKQLNELSVALGAGLEAAGKRIEDFGWTQSFDCQWKRLGEPDPPSRLTDADRAAFPAFAKAEAREAAQPEYVAGQNATGSRPGWSPF